ncbi:copper amine oxidase [Halobacillus ihumii]|uniref:copper amine oxidase n=1 Tax=Halobacillus ihumii TaxID=2686092 RepID=UPI001F07DF9A|nr:copper amine oxidase [Halobacillus ihumii]
MKTLKKAVVMFMAIMLLIPSLAMAHEGETHDKPTSKTPAADLRAGLDQLLSEHFVLATTAMIKDYNDAEDADEVYKKLDQNAKDMTPVIASVYGEEAAAKFEDIFLGHNDYTPDFVEAKVNNDKEARQAAEAEVDEFVKQFSSFLAKATEGNLPQEKAAKVLAAHEQDVINVFDYYVAGEYKKAYEAFREGFDRMFTISKALSSAIVTQMPEKFEGTKAVTPAADLRSQLNSLAAEHFALAILGMQKGYNQAEDYDFVTWAENMNTHDFTKAIESIYGAEAASQFQKIWQKNHIQAQGQLVTATLENDEEARMAAEQSLQTFAETLGEFLGKATGGNLPADAATNALWAHEEDVIQTFDHYVAGDYQATYESFRDGYGFMFGVGEKLSDAIVKQMPDKFSAEQMPSDMPKTGMGGTATNSLWTWAAFGALVLISGGFMIRKKAQQ